MKYSQLLNTLDKTGLSAEQLAPALGVSNMTIRRWRKNAPNKSVSKAYERLLIKGVQQMVDDGTIPPHTLWAQQLLAESSSTSVTATLNALGVDSTQLNQPGDQQERLIGFLQSIGVSTQHQSNVEKDKAKIADFKKLGKDWKTTITVLLEVIRSRQITQMDKLVAYGALFYLLCPIDLIPDTVPFFGLTDDFAFLTLAAGYYASRSLVTKTP